MLFWIIAVYKNATYMLFIQVIWSKQMRMPFLEKGLNYLFATPRALLDMTSLHGTSELILGQGSKQVDWQRILCKITASTQTKRVVCHTVVAVANSMRATVKTVNGMFESRVDISQTAPSTCMSQH